MTRKRRGAARSRAAPLLEVVFSTQQGRSFSRTTGKISHFSSFNSFFGVCCPHPLDGRSSAIVLPLPGVSPSAVRESGKEGQEDCANHRDQGCKDNSPIP